MSIANMHETIDYKKLIEYQANKVFGIVEQNKNIKVKQKTYVKANRKNNCKFK